MPLQFTAFGIVPSAVISVRTMSARKLVTVRDTPACANPQGNSRTSAVSGLVGLSARITTSSSFRVSTLGQSVSTIPTAPSTPARTESVAGQPLLPTVRWIQARRSTPRSGELRVRDEHRASLIQQVRCRRTERTEDPARHQASPPRSQCCAAVSRRWRPQCRRHHCARPRRPRRIGPQRHHDPLGGSATSDTAAEWSVHYGLEILGQQGRWLLYRSCSKPTHTQRCSVHTGVGLNP